MVDGAAMTTAINRQTVARRYGCEPGGRVKIGCVYCGIDIWVDWLRNRPRFLDMFGRSLPELDHVIPRFWNGPDTPENLVPACMSCNRKKGGALWPDGFRP